jgi:DNA-binding ferritin-like protein (Dps family)
MTHTPTLHVSAMEGMGAYNLHASIPAAAAVLASPLLEQAARFAYFPRFWWLTLANTVAMLLFAGVPLLHRLGPRAGPVATIVLFYLEVADAAARWHVHQRRKGAAKEPYINHLLEVATLVAEATEGKDLNLIIAALLHDAIEDCEVPHKLIADMFGNDVADLVAEVTDDKTLEKGERKKRQVDGAHKKTARAKILKLADKTSNLRALVSSPAPDWSVRRKIEYIEWARKVVRGLGPANEALERQFDEAALAAEHLLCRR